MEYLTDPVAIQDLSFEIIKKEERFISAAKQFTPEEQVVLRRIIHTTVDFDFADNLVFSKDAVVSGMEAIKAGADIITDVEMVKAGINSRKLSTFGGSVKCFIRDDELAELARKESTTRSIMAMRKAAKLPGRHIFAIGNAPTALLEIARMVEAGTLKPALVIGVPVGFVSARESKALLATLKNLPFITALGPKGGSSVAAATVNALLELLEHC